MVEMSTELITIVESTSPLQGLVTGVKPRTNKFIGMVGVSQAQSIPHKTDVYIQNIDQGWRQCAPKGRLIQLLSIAHVSDIAFGDVGKTCVVTTPEA